MTGTMKAMCQAAALALLLAVATAAPAKAQFGGGGGGKDMMPQMDPMLEMMKAKMGKKRFAMMMQTMGPMMSSMMDGGGGGMFGGGGRRLGDDLDLAPAKARALQISTDRPLIEVAERRPAHE